MKSFNFINSTNNKYYSEKEISQIEKHIEEKFGEVTKVFHEIVSDDIHLDILIIPPNEQTDFYKLFTVGMGAKRMNVPKKHEVYQLERAEIGLFLPSDFNIDTISEDCFWPAQLLKQVARMPFEQNSWIAHGHTVEIQIDTVNGNEFQGCTLLSLNGGIPEFHINSKFIHLYLIVPLYKDEINYLLNNNVDDLLDKFDENGITPVVDINRKSVV